MQKSNDSKKTVVSALSQLLADTYVIYVQTQNFHWNVTGPHFYAYHKLFEDQYKQLVSAIDEIAERIRSLHAIAPGAMSEFLNLSNLRETTANLSATQMIQTLLQNHEKMIQNFSQFFNIAKDNDDEVTLDLFIERKAQHEEMAWMLRSLGEQHI